MPPFFQQRAEVAMENASGVFRVTIEYKYPMVLLLSEAVGIVGVVFLGWDRQWIRLTGAPAIAAVLLVLNLIIVAWHMTASQIIEFSDRQIVVSRTNLGWQRTSEYALEKLSEFQWQKYWGKPGFFRCRFGWRPISFGKHLSQEQADRLLAELQTALPNVARHLLGGLPLSKAFTQP